MAESGTIKLDASWLEFLEAEFRKPYMVELREFLHSEKENKKIIYPRGDLYFNALNSTPLDKVKVVILGQDPYHGPGQAHGLCFSVTENTPPPPSLVNIFKEINSDLGNDRPFPHGDLTAWARAGVLLLNSVLTVERHRAASHQGRGWEQFTDKVIEVLSSRRSNCVFLLWGSYAQKKGAVIDADKHLVLKAPHPSPLSAHRGFLGCKHFSRCNAYLEKTNQKPVDWQNLDLRD